MKNISCAQALNAFEVGLTNEEPGEVKKKRNRRSKLEPVASMIKAYWAEKRSLAFIQQRIRLIGIECERSTILRFIQNWERL